MNTNNPMPTARDLELLELVLSAVNGVAIRDDADADVYTRFGTWWRVRINQDPKSPIFRLGDKALKALGSPFTVDFDEVSGSVNFDHPELSRPIEVRHR